MSDKTKATLFISGTMAFFLLAFTLFSHSSARADTTARASTDQINSAQSSLANCQLLVQNSTGAQRTRAELCVVDQQQILALLRQTSTASSSPVPTTPPTSQPPTAPTTRTCAPFPAQPDANCTGVPPGTVLRDCPNGIKGGVWDGCRFRGTLVVRGVGTVIKNSLILGNVDAGDAGNCSQQSGLQIIDSEINGDSFNPGWNAQLVGFNCYSLLRVNGHGTGYGVNASGNVTVTDSWLHDFRTYSQADHKDAIISNGGSNLRFIHNNLECSYNVGDGLCSASVGLFGDFAPINDVVVHQNLLNTEDGYCIYGGSTSSKPFPDASNVKITDNLFGKKFHSKCGYYGPSTDVELTRGNTWSGNRWQDGSGIVNPG